jgi:hypothetical protein
MRIVRVGLRLGVFVACCLQLMYAAESPRKATPPWKFTMNQGKSSVTFGFLAQPQFESLENVSGNGSLNNLFFRRLRFIAGGKITPKLSFFVESDAANLGKQLIADGPRMHDFFLQDAYINYAFRPEFQIDIGQLLTPVSHNSQQSAASLLPVDYGSYSFLATDSSLPRAGRDYGLQARGYIKKHFEYRLGMYRGSRNSNYWNNPAHDGDFPARTLARFVWYPLEADTGFFYTGTTHGQKKILGIGVSFDHQGDYYSNAVDVFFDHPLPNGDAVTVQADFLHYNGGTLYPALRTENTWLVEGSYYNKKTRLGPFMQFGSRDFTNSPTSLDEKKVQGGIAYWILKHKLNIKAGFGRMLKDNLPDRTQIVIQTQFFYY